MAISTSKWTSLSLFVCQGTLDRIIHREVVVGEEKGNMHLILRLDS